MSRPKPSDDEWATAVELYPPGSTAEATIVEIYPFGLFADLPGAGLVGFLAYPNIDPAGAPVPPGSDDVPAIGDKRRVVVVDQQHERRQLWLSCRLADFSAAS